MHWKALMAFETDGQPRVPSPEASEAPESGWPPPPARTPRAEEPWSGLFDAPEATRPPSSRRWLLVAAGVPWLVVAAILVTRPDGAPAATSVDAPPTAPAAPGTPGPSTIASATSEPTAPAAAAPEATAAPTAAPSAVPSVSAPSPGSDGVHRPPDTVVANAGQAVGVAVVTARTWLSGPTAGTDGTHYVEHLVAESTQRLAGDLVIVVVRAVLLPIAGDTYGAPEVARIAVPVEVSDHPRPAGSPWRLPPGEVSAPADPPATTAVDDPDLAVGAVDALQAAGYDEVQLVALGRTATGVYLADVEAAAPGTDAVAAHTVWLVPELGRLRVAGHPPGDGASPDPSPEAVDP